MNPIFTKMVDAVEAANAAPDDYINSADGLKYCGKCRTPKEAFYPADLQAQGFTKHPVMCKLAHNRMLGKALCLKVCGVKGFFRCAALATVFQPISGIDVIVWCGISSFNGINHFRKNRIHRHSPSLSS